ncbi:MBL fold metallo-hydrolase [Actinomadura geliboluensis]|uniref:MBL fold metallo-hydrolase n=1 Tax=Actinomadura geliboluensis TaxID=882440 RepID=A0A5S4H5X1_9ACTN|nr:MBL fold metallo-hydrolase [Actinomadura geliboluensis]TMR40625.1 MBL fold metallo-hydrolase [Actinomadura geliboluensis]
MTRLHGQPPARLEQLTDRVWAWVQEDGTWWVNNAGVVSGDDGLLIVDTCATERRTRAFLDAVDGETGGPVRWAVNTHAHGDHTYGNSLLPEDTVLIGHRLMCEHLRTDPVFDACPPLWEPVPDWGAVTRRVPELVLTDDLLIEEGGLTVALRHPGHPAHTTGDVVAWVLDQDVLFAGDLLFHGITPLVFMGSVEGALRSLDWLASFAPAYVVPGHGPVIKGGELEEVLARHRAYYRFVQELAAEGIRRGVDPLSAARTADLGPFAAWPDAERLVPNLHRAYADAGVGDVDVVAALTDAVTWAGHPLPTRV